MKTFDVVSPAQTVNLERKIMSDSARQIKFILLIAAGIFLALASVFFCYYTVRLLYLNLTMADAAAHRSGGMYIGAVVFPIATFVFGILSLLSFRTAKRLKRSEQV